MSGFVIGTTTGGRHAIKCLTCNRTSYNQHDIDNLYCGFCHKFHREPQGGVTAAQVQEMIRSGKVKVVMESSDQIDSFGDFAYQFIENVFGTDCLITDKSSLWDFWDRNVESKADIQSRIKQLYGVDVSDIEDGNLFRVLTAIRQVKP